MRTDATEAPNPKLQAPKKLQIPSSKSSITEAPHAVTWKEFDALVDVWEAQPESKGLAEWIRRHAEHVARPQLRVYSEVFDAALSAYGKAHRDAEGKFVDAEKLPVQEQASALLALIECLLFDLHDFEPRGNKLATDQVERLAETVASLSVPAGEFQTQVWPRTEQLLLRFLAGWDGDVTPLVMVIHPGQPYRFTHYEGASVRALHMKACAIVLSKFAAQLIDGFRRPAFIDRLMQDTTATYFTRPILFDPAGPLWGERRKEALAVLAEAASNRVVQENAYEFMWWCDQKMHAEEGSLETGQIATLLKDSNLATALWSAATATPISQRASRRLQRLPEELSKLGVIIDQPAWFTATLDLAKRSPSETRHNDESSAETT